MSRTVTEPYRQEITGAKGSIFYRAHSYHTKVPLRGSRLLLSTTRTPATRFWTPSAGRG